MLETMRVIEMKQSVETCWTKQYGWPHLCFNEALDRIRCLVRRENRCLHELGNKNGKRKDKKKCLALPAAMQGALQIIVVKISFLIQTQLWYMQQYRKYRRDVLHRSLEIFLLSTPSSLNVFCKSKDVFDFEVIVVFKILGFERFKTLPRSIVFAYAIGFFPVMLFSELLRPWLLRSLSTTSNSRSNSWRECWTVTKMYKVRLRERGRKTAKEIFDNKKHWVIFQIRFWMLNVL